MTWSGEENLICFGCISGKHTKVFIIISSHHHPGIFTQSTIYNTAAHLALIIPHLDGSYLGMVRFTVPTGKISIDFPQNLFFHLTSERQQARVMKTRRMFLMPLILKLRFSQARDFFLNWVWYLPCQKVKFLDSQWQAEMGGWWLTLGDEIKGKETRRDSCCCWGFTSCVWKQARTQNGAATRQRGPDYNRTFHDWITRNKSIQKGIFDHDCWELSSINGLNKLNMSPIIVQIQEWKAVSLRILQPRGALIYW